MIEAGWECKLHLFGDEQLRTLVRLNCSEDEYRRAQGGVVNFLIGSSTWAEITVNFDGFKFKALTAEEFLERQMRYK